MMRGVDDHPKIPEPVPPRSLPEFGYRDVDKTERIGSGGDADVYRGYVNHSGSSYSIAIKEPRFEGTIQLKSLERFKSEAETWSKLSDHQNIVSVYQWGSKPRPWLALEYMDGGTLRSKIGAVELDEALWLGGRIAEGIHHGHRHGVAHLDIKPTNVLLRETEAGTWAYPKVTDWGLAKLLLEHSNSIDGISPTYGAPEQFDTETFGRADDITDIYQLGAVIYALLTGDPPFSGSSRAVMRGVLKEEPAPPSEVCGDIPTEIDNVVLKALAKQKENRYTSVSLFQKEIDTLFKRYTDSSSTSSGAVGVGATSGSDRSEATDVTRVTSGGQSSSPAATGNERAESAQAESSGGSTDLSATDDRASLSRRRLLGLLGVGIIGTGGVLISRSSGSDDDSAAGATMPTAVPTTSQQGTVTPTRQSTTTQPEETPTPEATTTPTTSDTRTSGSADGIRISGFETGLDSAWQNVEAARPTDSTAFRGSQSLVITDQHGYESDQNGNKIQRPFDGSTPQQLTAALRMGTGPYNSVIASWHNSSRSLTIRLDNGSWAGGSRGVSVNGEKMESVAVEEWFYIDLSGIDWQAGVIRSVSVNGNQVAEDFRPPEVPINISTVSLAAHDAGTGSKGYFDQVTIGHE